jgi:hypothetical protein
LPQTVGAETLEQQHLGLSPVRPAQPQPRREDAGVVDDRQRVRRKLLGQLVEPAVADRAGRPLADQQPRVVAPLERALRDQLRGELVVEL